MPLINKIHKDELGFSKNSSNYYHNPTGAGDFVKPHLHLVGSTSALTGIITISSLSYTTVAGGRNNIRLSFNATTGFPLIRSEVANKDAFNVVIADINRLLPRR